MLSLIFASPWPTILPKDYAPKQMSASQAHVMANAIQLKPASNSISTGNDSPRMA